MSQLSEQEVVRREAMNKLRDLGIDPYPAEEYVSSHYSEAQVTLSNNCSFGINLYDGIVL